MNSLISLEELKALIPSEIEEYCSGGDENRCELTKAVMRELHAPSQWRFCGEYRNEFGGFFPVHIRFTPQHEKFHVAVCSPGDAIPVWMTVFIPTTSQYFFVIRTSPVFRPEVIDHTLGLIARLDSEGYTNDKIVGILAMEGGI